MAYKTILVGALVAAVVVVAVACGRDVAEQPTTATAGAPRRTSALHGTVHTIDGRPIADTLVNAASLDNPAIAIPEIAVVTDGAGNYEWPLTPGRYRISVDVAGIGTTWGDVTIGSEPRPVLDLTVS